MAPNTALAGNNQGGNNNHNNNHCYGFPWNRHCDNNNDHDHDRDNCRKHPERGECHTSVPEFGMIPGAIALLSSGGTFLYMKKRYSK